MGYRGRQISLSLGLAWIYVLSPRSVRVTKQDSDLGSKGGRKGRRAEEKSTGRLLRNGKS